MASSPLLPSCPGALAAVAAAAFPSGRARRLGSERPALRGYGAVLLAGRRVVGAAGRDVKAVAAAAAFPSERARRLASERLPLAALPGAVVLAGRRIGAPGRDVKAACAKDDADPPSMGDEDAPGKDDVKAASAKDQDDAPPRMADEDEFFEKVYRHRSKQFDDFLGLYMPLPSPLSKEEKVVQEKLKEIAEKCIALNHDAMSRLPHAVRCRLHKPFWESHFAFAVVRSRATNGRASMEMAVVIADKLYAVLKMVSFGCSASPPLDMKAKNMLIPFTGPVFPLDHGVEVLVFNIVDNLYNAVKRDVDAMMSGVSRA